MTTGSNTQPNDPRLLAAVLRPYRPHCRYLKSAVVSVDDDRETGRASAVCEFDIPESCYIDDTGHFNAVEFNICYNQMFYYLAAKLVQESLTAPFNRWTMADYWRRQLNNILIAEFNSVFKRAMRGRRFFGEITIDKVVDRPGSETRQPLLILYTQCRYWDEAGSSQGKVKLAITDPDRTRPQPSPEPPRMGQLGRQIGALPIADRMAALTTAIAAPFRTALMMGDAEPLPLAANYFDLGLTSLQANEIKQQLEAQLGCAIDTAALLSEPTVERLVRHIAESGLAEHFHHVTVPAAAAPTLPAARKPLVDEMLKRMYEA